jgi:hypothetical protein
MAGRDNNPSGHPPSEQRVFFEFTQLGQQFRVAAIDEATGTEVVIICPGSHRCSAWRSRSSATSSAFLRTNRHRRPAPASMPERQPSRSPAA